MDSLPAHSKLGASSYERWGACPGSVKLCEGIERKSSRYADEGTLAHDIAAKYLRGEKDIEGVSDEMWEHLGVYFGHIFSLRGENPHFEAIEQKFHLKDFHPDLFGTADYVCYFRHTKTIHVIDLKYGAGVAVSPENSKQLQYYALGALYTNNFPIRKIILTIIQPRIDHQEGYIRSWETDPVSILDFGDKLVEDAVRTEKENAPLILGEHCRWCPGLAVCPKKKEQAMIACQEAFSPRLAYDPEKLSQTLKILDQIESWAKGVREFAYREAESGRIPPGFKLVQKRPSRKWKDKVNESVLSDFFEIEKNEFVETKLKSPAQIEKILKKDDKKELEKFIIKESSGRNLVSFEDDRPEIDVMADIFPSLEN